MRRVVRIVLLAFFLMNSQSLLWAQNYDAKTASKYSKAIKNEN